MGQRELASRLGIGESAVSQWFSGLTEPDKDRYGPLADLLGVSAAWLAWGWGPKFPTDGPDLSGVARRRPRAPSDPAGTGGERSSNGG